MRAIQNRCPICAEHEVVSGGVCEECSSSWQNFASTRLDPPVWRADWAAGRAREFERQRWQGKVTALKAKFDTTIEAAAKLVVELDPGCHGRDFRKRLANRIRALADVKKEPKP